MSGGGGRRYGGAHSPKSDVRTARIAGTAAPATPGPSPSHWAGRQVRSTSMRATLLFVWPSFLFVGAVAALFEGDALGVAWMSACWLALMLAAGLTRTGVAAAAAYHARAVAKPPAFPRKLFAAALTALGVGVASWFGAHDIAGAAVFAAMAGGLHVAAFGPDPLRAKGVDGLEGAALDDAVTKIETARTLLGEMKTAIAQISDRSLETRVEGLAASAEQVIARIERDPRDLRRARRFLSVYLVGARDAAVKFARAWAENPAPEMRADYAALLDDLEQSFAAQAELLLEDDRTALDVEIEVLRERLKMEGV